MSPEFLLWFKVQTVRGCYGYSRNEILDGQKQTFEFALDWIAQKKIQAMNMLTHPFTIDDYRR